MVEVARMLSALSGAPMSEAQADAKAGAYAEALDGIPTWAIVAGRRDWYQGNVEGLTGANLAFPPSPAHLCILAKRHLHRVRGEEARLRILLAAKPFEPKPGNREMVERLRSLVGKVAS